MKATNVDPQEHAGGAGHALWLRLCHWAIAGAVITLAYSGVVILMAHPRLYWGNVGNDLTHAWIELPLGRNYHHGGWAPPLAFFADSAGPVSRVRTYDIFNQNGWARSLHFLTGWWPPQRSMAWPAWRRGGWARSCRAPARSRRAASGPT